MTDLNAPKPMIVGDYYSGSFGRTILLVLESPDGPRWLHDLFTAMARNTPPMDLPSSRDAQLKKVETLQMRLDPHLGPHVALNRLPDGKTGARFQWVASSSGWMLQAGLLEPFLKGKPGHQYLTREGIDAALIEVSYNEPQVRLGRGAADVP